MKSQLTLLFISWFLPLMLSAQTRHALLMGVGDYQGAKYQDAVIADLPGITTADLPNMASKLRSLGFTVAVVENPNLSQARTAVEAFKTRLSRATQESGGAVALFYFSGHGVEYQGQHYLIPSSAYMPSKADVEHTALNTQSVVNSMEESGATVCLSFLDCCRQDLGKNVGGADKTPLQAKGSFIGFATRSGGIADPGVTGSPFTRFLLQHLDTPGLSVADMYSQVISDVKAHALKNYGEDRRPGFYSELDAPFYFVPASYRKEADMQAEIERRAREMAAKMVPGAQEELDTSSSPSAPVVQKPLAQVSKGLIKAELMSLILHSSTEANVRVRLTNTSKTMSLRIGFDWQMLNAMGYNPNPPQGSQLQTAAGARLVCLSVSGVKPEPYLNSLPTGGVIDHHQYAIDQATEIAPGESINIQLEYGIVETVGGFKVAGQGSADLGQAPRSDHPAAPEATHLLNINLWQVSVEGTRYGKSTRSLFEFSDVPQTP